MKISMQRIYDSKTNEDNYRVLVDRLWPRGISKEEAALDDWWKDIAPSDDLRKWFGHKPSKWQKFREKYLLELNGNKELAKKHLAEVKGNLVLLYGAKDEKYNHARVLQDFLEKFSPGD